MKPKESSQDFSDRIAAARRNPLGWAVLPSTATRAAVRVTVLFTDGGDGFWVSYPGSGANVDLVPRTGVTHFVAHEKAGKRQ